MAKSREASVARQHHLCLMAAQCQALTIRATAAYRRLARRGCAERPALFSLKPKARAQRQWPNTCVASRKPAAVTSRCPHSRALLTTSRQLPSSGITLLQTKTGIFVLTSLNWSPSRALPMTVHSPPSHARKSSICRNLQLLLRTSTTAKHQESQAYRLKHFPVQHLPLPTCTGPSISRSRRASRHHSYGGEVELYRSTNLQKPLGTRSAWRSILLMEASSKAVCAAVRDSLLQGFARVAQPAQRGSRKGSSLQMPMAYEQLALDYLVRHNRSGGLVFFDGNAAFYATFREVVLGRDALLTPTQLEDLAARISPDAAVQEAFLAVALGSGVYQMDSASSSPARYIRLGFLSEDNPPSPPRQAPCLRHLWQT